MKVLSEKDILEIKHGDEGLLYYSSNSCITQLVVCEFLMPYNGWAIGVKIKQRPYSLIATDRERLAHYLSGMFALSLYKDN